MVRYAWRIPRSQTACGAKEGARPFPSHDLARHVTYHQNSDEGQRFCRMIPIFDPMLDWQRVKPMWAAIRLIDPASVAQEEPSLSDRSWEAVCGGAKSKCKVQFACTAK